jgi:rare lipoprotein A (peptidoglycan hydrolase)
MRTLWAIILGSTVFLGGCLFAPKEDGEPYFQPPMFFDKGTDYTHSQTLPFRTYYQDGRRYEPTYPKKTCFRTMASWYGSYFHGKKTASGEVYDLYAYSAAHKTLPIPSFAKITHLKNGQSIIVRINDRGPFIQGREIDLSWAAARKLGTLEYGVSEVEVDWLGVEPPSLWKRFFN